MTALLSRLYGGALGVDEATELSWEIASDSYVFGHGSEEPRERWRKWNDRDTELAPPRGWMCIERSGRQTMNPVGGTMCHTIGCRLVS